MLQDMTEIIIDNVVHRVEFVPFENLFRDLTLDVSVGDICVISYLSLPPYYLNEQITVNFEFGNSGTLENALVEKSQNILTITFYPSKHGKYTSHVIVSGIEIHKKIEINVTPREIPEHQLTFQSTLTAYREFWNDNKFFQEWKSPQFKEEDVKLELNVAAWIVTYLIAHLNKKDPSFKIRSKRGRSHEYLRSANKNDPEFIKNLVHATMQDVNGYIEGITSEDIEDASEDVKIKQYMRNMDEQDNFVIEINKIIKETKDISQITYNLSSSFNQHKEMISKIMQIMMKLDNMNPKEENKRKIRKLLVQKLDRLLNKIEQL